jgi:hypothetical protein
LIKNFEDAQNTSGSFGIYLPNNVRHIRNVTNFLFCSQKCWALGKNPDDPKKKEKKQSGNLGIFKILVDNFG